MSRFIRKAVISEVEGTDNWMLEADLVYESDLLAAAGYDPLVTIAAGFIYNGNSIPDWLRAIPILSFFIAPKIKFPGSAALHDFGYRFGVWPRAITDQLYREALEVEGASRPRRFFRYWGLRLAGWAAYKESDDGERI